MDVGRGGGRRVVNWGVKSISMGGVGRRRLVDGSVGVGECGRLGFWSDSETMLLISKASSMHWHRVSALQLPQVRSTCSMSSVF